MNKSIKLTKTFNIPRGQNIGNYIKAYFQQDKLWRILEVIGIVVSRDTVNKCNVATLTYTFV